LYKNLLSKVVDHPFSAHERLNGHEMYDRSTETNYEGVPITVYYYFDQQKALLDEKDIQRQEKILNTLTKKESKTFFKKVL
jgi:hypothetical protein